MIELFRILLSTKYADVPISGPDGGLQKNFFIYYNDSDDRLLPKLLPYPPEITDDTTCDKFTLYVRLCGYDSIKIPKSFNEVAKGEILSTVEIEQLVTSECFELVIFYYLSTPPNVGD